jgi:hypothetical protein
MALLDPRILPLLEVLATSGVDWLVFELMEGIGSRVTAEESERALAQAREDVSNAHDARPIKADTFGGDAFAPTPIKGDEQILWAAEYVFKRIEDILSMLSVGLGHLNSIVEARADFQELGSRVHRGPELTLVLQGEESDEKVRQGDVQEATKALLTLKHDLEIWVKQTTELTPRDK